MLSTRSIIQPWVTLVASGKFGNSVQRKQNFKNLGWVRAPCVCARLAAARSLRLAGGEGEGQVLRSIMAITQFRLFKVCTCLATVFSFLKRLICRSGRGRKLSGDQITLPTTVDYSSVPKQTDVEEWTSWDEDAPTSVKIEGGNGNVATQQNALEQLEPDYFKDMTPTIRKTQKVH